MDKFKEYMTSCKEEGYIDCHILALMLEDIYNVNEDIRPDEKVYTELMGILTNNKMIEFDNITEIHPMFFANRSKTESDPGLNEIKSDTDDASVDDNDTRAVPEPVGQTAKDSLAKKRLDYRRRTQNVLSKNAIASATEGNQLLRRNISNMSPEDLAIATDSIEPRLASDMTSFAVNAGINPLSRSSHSVMDSSTPGSDREDIYETISHAPVRQTLSDSDQSGFSTPNVSRTVLRQRLRTQPYAMPPSPTSPQHPGGSNISPLSESAHSPAYAVGQDYDDKMKIQDLISQKARLQKSVNEKSRIISTLENQLEKNTADLERDLDDCKAELTTKKRDIEHLKVSERRYSEGLRAAEAEVERIAGEFSNSVATSNDLKNQLEKKSAQMAEAEEQIAVYQKEVSVLKANLDANIQQQQHLSKEHSILETQMIEISQELKTARESEEQVEEVRKENVALLETVDKLRAEIDEMRANYQQSAEHTTSASDIPDLKRKSARYKSLRDELAETDSDDLSSVDDLVYPKRKQNGMHVSLTHKTTQTEDSTPEAKKKLADEAVYAWISNELSKCSLEDLFILYQVWKRIGYCDNDTENQESLRHDLMDALMSSKKLGLKQAIRDRGNPSLARILDSVSGDSSALSSVRMSAGHHYAIKNLVVTKSRMLPQFGANGQYTTGVVILYSVVVFCLGIITASFFNSPQTLSTLPLNMANSTINTLNDVADGGMNLVRQILVVDDTPAHDLHAPIRKNKPRSRLGEIFVYWMETLLWDESDDRVPT